VVVVVVAVPATAAGNVYMLQQAVICA